MRRGLLCFLMVHLYLLFGFQTAWPQTPSPSVSSRPQIQQQAPPSFPPSSLPSSSAPNTTTETEPQRRMRLALEVLQLTDGFRPIDASIEAWVERYQGIYSKMPQEIWQQVRAKLKSEMVQMTAGAWARHYTEEELQSFAAFYKSPAGQSLARKRGGVVRDVVKHGEEIGVQMDQALRSVAAKQGIEPHTAPSNSQESTPQPSPPHQSSSFPPQQPQQLRQLQPQIIERPGSLPPPTPQVPPKNILQN